MKYHNDLSETTVLLFIIFIMAALAPRPASAQTQTDTHILRGKVLQAQTRNPVASATVVLHPGSRVATTDENGRFEFKIQDPSGDFSIAVHRIGFERLSRSVSSRMLSEPLTLSLKEKPYIGEEVIVQSSSDHYTSQLDISEARIHQGTPKDAGEIFSQIAGFGLIKRGGFSLDPVLRTFKNEQLNVQYDSGIRVSHACPNRMDPVTTHIAPEELASVEVIKGPYSVRYGSSMGGIIQMNTHQPEGNVTEGIEASGSVDGGYTFNGQGKRGGVQLELLGNQWDAQLSGNLKDFEDYSNGSGTEIPTSFRSYDYGAKFNVRPSQSEEISVNWHQSFGRDIRHVGLPMDTDTDDSYYLSVDYDKQQPAKSINSIAVNAYTSFVDHVMSNKRRPNYMMVHAVSNVTSRTLGGKVEAQFSALDKGTLFAGTDYYLVKKDGERDRTVLVNMMTGEPFDTPKNFTDQVWQGAYQHDAGLFSELHYPLSDRLSLVTGLRINAIVADAEEPASVFEDTYGELQRQEDFGWQATASGTYQLDAKSQIRLALGRGQRAPNLGERYINHLTVGMDAYEYMGNPGLDPEQNYQADLIYSYSSNRFMLETDLFYSYMTDYITAAVNPDIRRVYMPSQDPKYVKQYTNIDEAIQRGFEAKMSYQLLNTLGFRGSVGYTWAKNLEWDEPLPEIPPLESTLAARYEQKNGRYWAELELRLVGEQDRVAPSFNESATGGFEVVNAYLGYRPLDDLEIRASIENIFDATYYEHLSRSYKNMPESRMFYEPGFNANLQLSYRF